jgi:hypothetical protein
VLLSHVLVDPTRRKQLFGTGKLGDALALAWGCGRVLAQPGRDTETDEFCDLPAAAQQELATMKAKLASLSDEPNNASSTHYELTGATGRAGGRGRRS